jgi:ribose-phosphate pyrophosphokinase
VTPAVLAGSANVPLAQAIASQLGVALVPRILERFPDGEVHVEVQKSVCGDDVCLVQPTGPPVDGNLLELMLLADACRRDGSRRLTAVVPYFGYARQDRRARGREAVGARLVADLFRVGRFERILAVDLHSPSLEGFFEMPVEALTAVPLLAEAARPFVGEQTVVVAPDLGAAKLADRYGRLLDCPVAVVHKTRLTGSEVSARGVSGNVQGRRAILVDDMVSTGATIEAASRALEAAGALPGSTVVASHGLFCGDALERLAATGVAQLIVTDSLPGPSRAPLPIRIVRIGGLLATAIERLHADRPVANRLPSA